MGSKVKRSREKKQFGAVSGKNTDNLTLWAMNEAPEIGESRHIGQMIPAIIFSAIVILIVRLHLYERNMGDFFWRGDEGTLGDFFNYNKMVLILLCGGLALIYILYRLFAQNMYIRKSPYYISMGIYSMMVLISYAMSEYKDFALWGWNDRFEGTLVLLTYMVMLFFIVNTINGEKNVKQIIYGISASSAILGLIGLSQGLGHDIFKTRIGKLMINPAIYWDQMEKMTYNLDKYVYQTVYNPNYVSFYLNLILPILGLLFIRSVTKAGGEPVWKKIMWGVLFGLNMYCMIGAKSSGGILGFFVMLTVAVVLFNKKILKWVKPLGILVAITVLICGVTFNAWTSELSSIFNSPDVHKERAAGHIDYIETVGNDIHISYDGNVVIFKTNPKEPKIFKVTDSNDKDIDISVSDNKFILEDGRFPEFSFEPAQDETGLHYIVITIAEREWPFAILKGADVRYRNLVGNLIPLTKIESVGWERSLNFGSGRGLIWSRTIPMMADTVLVGKGADTYCIYYPHNDVVGLFNAGYKENLFIDKPHNMYMGAWVGTGGISVIAMVVMFGMYIASSFKIYRQREFDTFMDFVGAGCFLGVCGFLAGGLTNDSSVSVMPMFYSILGTGMAINILLKKAESASNK